MNLREKKLFENLLNNLQMLLNTFQHPEAVSQVYKQIQS